MHIGTALVEGAERVVVRGEGVVVVVPTSLAPSVRRALERWDEVRERLEDGAAGAGGWTTIATDDVVWAPPLPRPSKIVCLALNNSANRSRIISGPTHPATFVKPSSSLVGHGQPIVLRPEYGRVHPEPELAVVIGRRASRVSADQALDHVFGYTVVNDLTSPTMRAQDTFHYRAIHPRGADATQVDFVDTWVSYPGRYKGADTFCPAGPWIATRDSVPDPHALTITCSHQGRVATEDSTANLTWHTAEAIEFISSYQTLEPGDMVSLGTALKASGGGQPVQNVDLNTLDGPVEVEISRIGRLSNPVQRS